jgi:DNA invertase Pin-like site-specific DNA recombinase
LLSFCRLLSYIIRSLSRTRNRSSLSRAKRRAKLSAPFALDVAEYVGWDRPELHPLVDQLREADVLVLWKRDRLSDSSRDVLKIMERLAKAKAGFPSLNLTVVQRVLKG